MRGRSAFFFWTHYVMTGCNIVPSAVIIDVASPGRCDDNSPLKHCLHGFRIFQPATFDSRRMINLTRVGEIGRWPRKDPQGVRFDTEIG
jgi:hypothetical protein